VNGSALVPRPVSQRGLSLIEIMLALALGLLVSLIIGGIFTATSKSHRVQSQLARLQEEGRFAMTRIGADLRMANTHYCSNSGGVASETAQHIFLDRLRSPRVYAKYFNTTAAPLADLSTPWGGSYPALPATAYALPSFLFMRGYDCGLRSCAPTSPPASIAGMSSRVPGTDVLTMRYLDASLGWALRGDSKIIENNQGEVAHTRIVPGRGEPELTTFKPGHLGMLADCSQAQVFAVVGNPEFVPDAHANFIPPMATPADTEARFFDFTTGFRTVTYFVKMIQEISEAGPVSQGALIRCDAPAAKNEPACTELARGVERLDFRYAVEDAQGGTRYLDAAEVDTRAGNTIACPPAAPDSPVPDTGCLWRAVKSIEVHLLLDGQLPLYTLTAAEMAFAYSIDGIHEPKAPDDRGDGIAPASQGFALPLLRREFSTVVSLRNYNP
jgi:type IV pilus assembly protein PilW